MTTKTRRGLKVKVVGLTFHEGYPEWTYDYYPDFPDAVIQLVREPENEYDANAIGVHVNGHMVGHIPAVIAEKMAPDLDAGVIWAVKSASVLQPPAGGNPGVELVLTRDSSHLN